MNLFQRTGYLARATLKRAREAAHYAITGHWEGYEINRYRNRPFRRLESQDRGLDLGTRESMISEARALEQTFGVVGSILSKYADYCVGSCEVQFNTSDNKWNELAEENWRNACGQIDLLGIHNFQSLARLALISEKRDGDVFFVKTLENGIPQLQAIEADRVTNAVNSSVNVDTNRIIGGVLVNAQGAPYAYRVCERSRYGTFINPRDIPKKDVFHLYSPRRIDALRSVTIFKTALNHLRDLKEIIAAEKTAVKAHSKIAFLVNNMMGGPAPDVNLVDDKPGSGDGSTAAKVEELGDGIIQYLFQGDKFQAFAAQRPSDQTLNLVVLLIRDIAIGAGLPFEFVWNMASLGGPAVRFMSQQAKRTFDTDMDNMERRLIKPAVAWVTNVSMNALKRLPFNPEWYNFYVQRPAHPTIDVGRESAANLAEHQRGVLAGKSIAAERGEDIFDVHAQLEREADDLLERAERLASKRGVTIELALSMLSNRTQSGNSGFDQPQHDPQQRIDREPISK